MPWGVIGGERGLRESGKDAVQRGKKSSSPLHHGFSGRERCRGLEEYHMSLCYKFGLKEISGNGQNMHFKFLPEGV